MQNVINQFEKINTIELLEEIQKREQSLQQSGTERIFEPNHILEIYLYEFYCEHGNYKVVQEGIHTAYNILTERMYKRGDYEKAEEYIQTSLNYNCTDMETCELYIKILYKRQKWRKMIDTAFLFYPFCYTRKDIAFFYRTIGCYALETYQAKLARMIYAYSNLFYKSVKADEEIKYLNEALEDEIPSYTLEELGAIIKKNSLPEQPKKETLGIVYKVAAMEQKENSNYAKFLFLSLYQLTQDEEIERYLKE